MTCIWSGNLHRWRVNRSNKYCWKQFLNLDDWIQNPKSRECDEHTWFVVRLRIGPVTESLKKLTDLKLKDNSHLILQSKHVHSQIDTQGTEDFHLWRTACTVGTCHHIKGQRTHVSGLGQPAQIHQAQIGTLFMAMLSDPHIHRETMNLKSFNDCIHFIYISKLAPWMPLSIGLLLMNMLYEMLQ